MVRVRVKKCLLDTMTYVKVSGGHFELEDTIKCYTYSVVINKSKNEKRYNLEYYT